MPISTSQGEGKGLAEGHGRHPPFKQVEESRPNFPKTTQFHFVKTPEPAWKYGDGADEVSSTNHKEIDPYAPGRLPIHNYKLLISGIVPRPIGFVSTIAEDGKSTNLAPFSYFSLISHDPPLFTLGFSGGWANAKDTLRNLGVTKECTLNIISEDYIEAANSCSINAPLGVSEWALAGLHPAKSSVVRPDRVKEAIFSIEAQLVETREWESRATPGKKTGVLGIVEGVRFWVREDAIDDEGVLIDLAVLKPVSRLGGISYGRTTEAFELPRPTFEEAQKNPEAAKFIKEKVHGQLE